MTESDFTDAFQNIPRVVVIGGSAGGLSAIKEILSDIPANFIFPIICVQHIKPDPDLELASILRSSAHVRIMEANDKLIIEPGCFYISPPDYHLLVERDARLALSVDDPVNFSRPSIDVLFESAAFAFGTKVIGVILTGASKDGAVGVTQIRNHGGLTIVQDPSTAEMTLMPMAAIATNHVDKILPLDKIGAFLRDLAAQEHDQFPSMTRRW